MKLFLILSTTLLSFILNARTPCVEKGCFCSDASQGQVIPITCYSNYSNGYTCCDSEAPKHVVKHFLEIRKNNPLTTILSDEQIQALLESENIDCFQYKKDELPEFCKDAVITDGKRNPDEKNGSKDQNIRNADDGSLN